MQDLEEGKISKFSHSLLKLVQKHSIEVANMFEILAKRKVLKVLEKINEGGKQFREVFLILKRNPIPFRELDVVKLRGL